MATARGRFLLLGSGEFEPWAADAERFALSGATGDGAGAQTYSGCGMRFPFASGLNLLPTTAVGVHWDALSASWIRWLRDLAPRRLPSGVRFVGIAERTAIATDADSWRVFGAGVVDMRRGSERRALSAGQRFPM